MPFQAVPNAVLLTVQAKLDGEDVNNTLGFGLVTPAVVTAQQLQTIIAQVGLHWRNQIMPYLATAYIYQGITGRVLDREDGPVAEDGTGAGQAGTQPGNILPNNNAFVISFKTGLGGATNRGRNYVAGLVEPLVTGSLVDIPWATELRDAYAAMVGPGALSPGWTWCVISRKIIIPTVTGRAVPITTVVINDFVVDSQRRRSPGRGQ